MFWLVTKTHFIDVLTLHFLKEDRVMKKLILISFCVVVAVCTSSVFAAYSGGDEMLKELLVKMFSLPFSGR